jgi:phage-related protein
LTIETDDETVIPTTQFRFVVQVDVGTGGGNGVDPRPNYPNASPTVSTLVIDRVDIYSYDPSAGGGGGGGSASIGGVEDLPTVDDEATCAVTISAIASEPLASEEDTCSFEGSGYLEISESEEPDTSTCVAFIDGQADSNDDTTIIDVVKKARLFLCALDDQTMRIELTSFIDDLEVLRGAGGLLAPPIEIRRTKVPTIYGQITNDISYGIKTATIPLMACHASYSDLINIVNRISSLFRRSEKRYCVLKYIHPNKDESDLTIQIISGLEISNLGDPSPNTQEINLVVEAEDPFWRRKQISVLFQGSTSSSWFPIFREDYSWLSGSTISGNKTVVVDSDINTFPVWTIVGKGTDLVLSNNTTGKVLALSGEIAANEIVTIDTRDRGDTAKTVRDSSGASLMSRLTSRQLWSLNTGTNEISISFADTTEDSYISLAYTPLKEAP